MKRQSKLYSTDNPLPRSTQNIKTTYLKGVCHGRKKDGKGIRGPQGAS